jgi:hypothetical protein
MMKNFMILGSLTPGMEPDEDPGASDTMPFPEEDAVITVYDGRPPPRRRCMSNLSHVTPTHYGWRYEDIGPSPRVMDPFVHHPDQATEPATESTDQAIEPCAPTRPSAHE